MVRRCYDRRDARFSQYGGRGIRVCGRWRHDFMAFFSDMGLRPSPEHSLDRRDNDGDYTPENCRWATRSEQQRNTRRVLQASGAVRDGIRWRAMIGVNGRTIMLGRFARKTEARRAYRQASRHARLLNEVAAATIGLPSLADRCPECGWHENLTHPTPAESDSTRQLRPSTARSLRRAERPR